MATSMTHSEDLAEVTGLSERQTGLIKIFQQMRQLSHYVSTSIINEKRAHVTSYSQRIYTLERQLLLLSISGDTMSTSPMESFINRSCRSAAFVYIYAALRDVPLGGRLFDKFVERLRSALDHPGFMLAWSNSHPSMLLWVLVLGSLAATGRPERSWFVSQFVGVCMILNLQSLQEMLRVLQNITWVKGFHEGLVEKLWTEVELQVGSARLGKRKDCGGELTLRPRETEKDGRENRCPVIGDTWREPTRWFSDTYD